MPGDIDSVYQYICQLTDHQPDNVAHRQIIYGFLNANVRSLFTRKPWTFARKVAQVTLRGDVVGGTATFTQGSKSVVGIGTAFTSAMEGMWINVGLTDFNPAHWFRIGRVQSTTQAYLDEQWLLPGIGPTTYTLRQRFVAMPRDCVNYQNVWDSQDVQGILGYQRPESADRGWFDESITGTPKWYSDADSWNPRTPDRAPTATLHAALGSLVADRPLKYKYTWLVGDTETGASPIVEITPTGTSLQVDLSGFQENLTAADGRKACLYKADDTGIFYKLDEFNGATYVDDGSVAVNRAIPYTDANNRQYIRVYPRLAAGSDDLVVSVRYWFTPRELQKASDYPEMPPDAEEAVKAMTIADVFTKNGNAGQANVWRALAKERIGHLERHYLTQRTSIAVRRPYGQQRSTYMMGTDPVLVDP